MPLAVTGKLCRFMLPEQFCHRASVIERRFVNGHPQGVDNVIELTFEFICLEIASRVFPR